MSGEEAKLGLEITSTDGDPEIGVLSLRLLIITVYCSLCLNHGTIFSDCGQSVPHQFMDGVITHATLY